MLANNHARGLSGISRKASFYNEEGIIMSNCIHTLIKEIAETGNLVVLETVRSINENCLKLTINDKQSQSFNILTAVASSLPLSAYSGEWQYSADGIVTDVKNGKPIENLRKVQRNWVSVNELITELDIELLININGEYDFQDLSKQVLYKARVRNKMQTKIRNALKTSSIHAKRATTELHCIAA